MMHADLYWPGFPPWIRSSVGASRVVTVGKNINESLAMVRTYKLHVVSHRCNCSLP